MSCDDMDGRAEISVRYRNAVISRHSDRRGHARDHFIRDPIGSQKFQLLSASSEQERISAFQSHDTVSLLRFLKEHLIDLLLRHGVLVCTLSYVDESCRRRYFCKYALSHQTVIDDNLCLGENLHSFECKKTDISRSCSYEPYLSLFHSASPLSVFVLSDSFICFASAMPSTSASSRFPRMLSLNQFPVSSL